MSSAAEQVTEKGRPAPPPVGRTRRRRPHGEDTRIWSDQRRIGGLRRFAVAITVLNLLGHLFLGFETSWAQPFAAIATAYTLELLLEFVDARARGHRARYREGGRWGLIDFLLSAHITAMAVSMLIYPNSRLWPVVFATAVAIGSKWIVRVEVEGRSRHVMNPSNLGIATTLLAFPWVGIAAPYQFTENLLGFGNWVFPLILICLGSFLNYRFTRRSPLLVAWLLGFGAQALLRYLMLDAALLPALAPMTGVAFLLFTFYMVTDPATTPNSWSGQIFFGLGVAATYGLLMSLHIVFGLFFSLVIVCGLRTLWLEIQSLSTRTRLAANPAGARSPTN